MPATTVDRSRFVGDDWLAAALLVAEEAFRLANVLRTC
jgi:hypothetical protein